MSILDNDARSISKKLSPDRTAENNPLIKEKSQECEQLSFFEPPPTLSKYLPQRDHPPSQMGAAAETYTQATLLGWDVSTFLSTPGSPWDLGCQIGNRIILGQVKSTRRLASPDGTMSFDFYRTSFSKHGPTKKYHYRPDEFHFSACVNFLDRRVLFFPGCERNIRLKRAQFMHQDAELNSWLNTLKKLGIKRGGAS